MESAIALERFRVSSVARPKLQTVIVKAFSTLRTVYPLLQQLDADCAAAKELNEASLETAYAASAQFVRARSGFVQLWLFGTCGDLPAEFAPQTAPGGAPDQSVDDMMKASRSLPSATLWSKVLRVHLIICPCRSVTV